MLTITESAWARISQLLSARPDASILRIKQDGGNVMCHRGNPRKLDEVISLPGRPTLLMTPAVAKNLSSCTLDAADTDSGPRLRLV